MYQCQADLKDGTKLNFRKNDPDDVFQHVSKLASLGGGIKKLLIEDVGEPAAILQSGVLTSKQFVLKRPEEALKMVEEHERGMTYLEIEKAHPLLKSDPKGHGASAFNVIRKYRHLIVA
jgi:hypothetical protein